MRNRDIFLPSLTTLVISSMMVFLSCAHQPRDNEEDYSASEEVVSDAGATEAASTDTSELTDVTQVEEGAAQNSETASAVNELTTNPPAENTDATLSELGLPNDTDLSQAQGAIDTNSASAEQAVSSLESSATEVPVEAAAGSAAAEIDSSVLGLDSQSQNEVATNSVQEDALGLPPETAKPEPLPVEPTTTELPPALESAPVSRGAVTARAPKIPKKAISRKGALLNRYYFVRSGDTPSSLSTLLYGDASHAKKLTRWNGTGWKPGKLVYYNSPMDTQDGQMQSFYQERNVSPEDYEVKRGDWLSRIAQRNLGSAGSWKEIAVANGMRSPDSLEVGQKLALFPRDLSGYAPGRQQETAPADEPPPTAKLDSAPKTAAPVAQEPVSQPPVVEEPQAPVAEAIPAPEDKKSASKNKSQGLDINKIIDQNLFPIVIGAGVLILLLALSAISKKKKARASEEFGEDGFAPPSKMKRR